MYHFGGLWHHLFMFVLYVLIHIFQNNKLEELAFAKSCILKVSQDFKTFLRSLARPSRLSRLLKPEKYTMNIV